MAKITTSKNTYVTETGLKEARAELNNLKKVRRQEISERIERAREFGGISENSEYDAALEEQVMLENKIEGLEELLNCAQVIGISAKSDFVSVGSTVKVEMDGEINKFTIVGSLEANPVQKKISNESPMGKALLGSKKGEVVEIATPTVRYKCKILEIQ